MTRDAPKLRTVDEALATGERLLELRAHALRALAALVPASAHVFLAMSRRLTLQDWRCAVPGPVFRSTEPSPNAGAVGNTNAARPASSATSKPRERRAREAPGSGPRAVWW
jgi:hypothetical protein